MTDIIKHFKSKVLANKFNLKNNFQKTFWIIECSPTKEYALYVAEKKYVKIDYDKAYPIYLLVKDLKYKFGIELEEQGVLFEIIYKKLHFPL